MRCTVPVPIPSDLATFKIPHTLRKLLSHLPAQACHSRTPPGARECPRAVRPVALDCSRATRSRDARACALDYPQCPEHRQTLDRELTRANGQLGDIFFRRFERLAIFAYALPLSGKQLPRKRRLFSLARFAELQRQNKHLVEARDGHSSADYW